MAKDAVANILRNLAKPFKPEPDAFDGSEVGDLDPFNPGEVLFDVLVGDNQAAPTLCEVPAGATRRCRLRATLSSACLMGLEGLVSKHKDRPYRPGRSQHWIKNKNRQHPAFSRVRDQFS